MSQVFRIIVISIVIGTFARIFMIRVDYRQYPSYPQSFVSQLILGFVAACLGSVVTPSFLEKNYQAVTFLGLATAQFKDIREMERKSLENLEDTELVPRGKAYIEDIAKRFEARNYVAFLTSFLVCSMGTGLSLFLSIGILPLILISVCVGFFIILFLDKIMKPQTIKDIAKVEEARIHFKGPQLMVDEVVIMNVGYTVSKEVILERGIGLMLYPNGENAIATLANIGQRQAILHNLATQLGIRKDVDEPDFTPLARREADTGKIGIFIQTMNNSPRDAITVVENVPVLESARRKPKGTKKKEG